MAVENDRRIIIDGKMRTNIPNVYAVGDVTTKGRACSYGHESGNNSGEADRSTLTLEYAGIPRSIFGIAEIASAGLTQEQAVAKGYSIATVKSPFALNGKALALHETHGFVKLIADKHTSRLLGAHMIEPHAFTIKITLWGGLPMKAVLFTAPGCARCKVIKEYMNTHNIPYEEKNIKEEGKSYYQKFYAANRSTIYRGLDGIEFPIFTDGSTIKQSIGPILAYLKYQDKLNGFVRVGNLHKEWVDGITISGGDKAYNHELLDLIKCLKDNHFKLEIATDGRNAQILETILHNGWVDSLIIEVKGPKELYPLLLGEAIALQEVEKTIKLASQFSNTRFVTVIAPVWESGSDIGRFISAKEVGQTAQWIKELTGNNKAVYLIQNFSPQKATEPREKLMEPLDPAALFPYRNAARVYLVRADIEK